MPVWDTERTRPVIEALRDELYGGEWHSHADLMRIMRTAGDLGSRTCANMLRELVRDWSLDIRGSYRPGGRSARDTRTYRAVSPEALQPKSEHLAAIDRDLRSLRKRREHQNARLAVAAAEVARLTEEIKELEEMRKIMDGDGEGPCL